MSAPSESCESQRGPLSPSQLRPHPGRCAPACWASSHDGRAPRDGICWAVRQLYGDTGRPGRFLLQGEAVAAGGGYGAGGGADPPAPHSPGRPRTGGCGRRGHGLPRLCRLVPGEGAAAVGEAVRYVLGPWVPGLLRPQGCWVGWVGPLLPPACPCSSAQMWGQNGTGKRGSRGQIAARGTQPSPQSALQAPAPWVPRSPCVLHAVRSLPVSDSFLSVFEQRVQGANLTEDHTLFFPKYGECHPLPLSPPGSPPTPHLRLPLPPGPAPRFLRGRGPVPHPGR